MKELKITNYKNLNNKLMLQKIVSIVYDLII